MSSQPMVSIIIPTLNEEQHIGSVLEACLSQSYPEVLVEVVVADGRSTDATRILIRRYEEESQRIKLIDNPDRHQSSGLNAAVAASSGDIIARWDAHAEYDDDYLELAVSAFNRLGVDVVGGIWEPVGEGRIGSWVAAAMKSRIGVGNDRFIEGSEPRATDTVSGGVMTRATFESVGGYDTSMRPAGEDADIMFRIRAAGGSIVLDPAIRATYFTRDTVLGLVRQYFGYGTAKARMFVKHGMLPSLRPLAPAALVAVVIVGLAVPALRLAAATLLAGYMVGLVAVAVALVPGTVRDRLGVALVAPLMHLPFGMGVWVGLIPSRRAVPRTRGSR